MSNFNHKFPKQLSWKLDESTEGEKGLVGEFLKKKLPSSCNDEILIRRKIFAWVHHNHGFANQRARKYQALSIPLSTLSNLGVIINEQAPFLAEQHMLKSEIFIIKSDTVVKGNWTKQRKARRKRWHIKCARWFMKNKIFINGSSHSGLSCWGMHRHQKVKGCLSS